MLSQVLPDLVNDNEGDDKTEGEQNASNYRKGKCAHQLACELDDRRLIVSAQQGVNLRAETGAPLAARPWRGCWAEPARARGVTGRTDRFNAKLEGTPFARDNIRAPVWMVRLGPPKGNGCRETDATGKQQGSTTWLSAQRESNQPVGA